MYHYKSESPLAENSELKKRKAGVSILRLTNDTAFATISSTTGKQKLTDLDKPNKNKEGSFTSNKKIVFCGCGPMGEGILGGLLNNNVAKAKDVTVNELMEVRRTYIAETYGVAAVENASDALKAADLVIIAVNPAQMPKVAQTIRPLIKKACIVMSIACGVSQVLDNTGAYPAKQVDDMTSPGGVTIEALQVLQQKGFAGTLMSSVDAAVKKANSIH